MQQFHVAEAKSIKATLGGIELAAFTSGGTSEGKAWLIAAGPFANDGTAMPNNDYDIAFRIRLFLPVINPTQCPSCQTHITEDGHHAFSCPALRPKRTQRHTRVQDAVLSATRNLKHQNIRVTPNKNMDSYVRTPAGNAANVKHRMDIEYINTNEGPKSTYAVDFVVTGVTNSTLALRSAAGVGEKAKVDHYTKYYHIPEVDKRLVPWAIEAPGGAWGRRGIKFAKYLAKEQFDRGSGIQSHAFYRMIVVRTSVALQCENAAAVRLLDANCRQAASQHG
jgi:hypothetical protein